MPALKVRADYEALGQIAAEFGRQAGIAGRMLLQLRLQKDILQTGHWVGKGADKFYAEMDSSVLPAIGRLVLALETACRVTGHIIQVIREAEAEASKRLSSDIAVMSVDTAELVVNAGATVISPIVSTVAGEIVQAEIAAADAAAKAGRGAMVAAATGAIAAVTEVVTEVVKTEAEYITGVVQVAAVASEAAVEFGVNLTRGALDIGASVAAYAIGQEMHQTQEKVSSLKSELGALEQNLDDLMHEMEDAQQHETDMESRVEETDKGREAVLDNLSAAAAAAGDGANAIGDLLGR